jgi:hypothetical protein
MKKNILLLSSLILGALFGLLLGISIKYPLSIEQIESSKNNCETHGGLETVYIKVNGKIDSVVCKDGISFIIKRKQLSQQQLRTQD